MRKLYRYITMCIFMGLACTGCDVHEFPDEPETRPFCLELDYRTDLPQWEHLYDARSAADPANGGKSVMSRGDIRYIIRAYQGTETKKHSHEFVVTRSVSEGYDYRCTLDLPPGDYSLRVWSDLSPVSGTTPIHYDTGNFSEILLRQHEGNTDYRDAFRGRGTLKLEGGILERQPDTVRIVMERPLAKYEFITTDLKEFIDKEVQKAISRGEMEAPDDTPTRGINIEDYRVVFQYPGFMPNTFSMVTDRPVDSATGVQFESKITRLNDTEASLGFDYVFANAGSSVVVVQIALYDKDGKLLSLTDPIDVPLVRSKHTLMKGRFLMLEMSGGIHIDSEFDGEHNYII